MLPVRLVLFFFFNDTATTEIYTLSLHDALPISARGAGERLAGAGARGGLLKRILVRRQRRARLVAGGLRRQAGPGVEQADRAGQGIVLQRAVGVVGIRAVVAGDVDDEVDAGVGVDAEGAVAAQADGEGVGPDLPRAVVDVRGGRRRVAGRRG